MAKLKGKKVELVKKLYYNLTQICQGAKKGEERPWEKRKRKKGSNFSLLQAKAWNEGKEGKKPTRRILTKPP